jgi:hypothetical protein
MQHTLKLAINRHIINKIEFDPDPRWEIFTAKCENVELTLAEFADHINQGHAFCAQHAKRKRNGNFTGTNVLAVDIDKRWTVEQALSDLFVQRYASLLYTTPSHTAEEHHFRIVFVLDRVITDAAEMRIAYQGIIRKFGGDESCKDACRGFFGSTDSKPVIIGNVLPNEELAKIITLGGQSRISDRICGDTGGELGGKATQRSNDPLEKDQLVQLARGSGRLVSLADLPKGMGIHCPVHRDRSPSAFVVVSKAGVNGVRCHTCASTFWPPSELRRKRKPYDFYEIEDIVMQMEYDQDSDHYDEDDADAPPGIRAHAQSERTAYTFSSQFLPDIEIDNGVTFVRSPKGSGKTQWLENVVKRCRLLNQSVLLVGHRQTLIQGIARRLKLTCYFYTEGGKIKNNQSDEYYAICVDSIGKLLRPNFDQYDVVIIDEAEQVFSHLTASTLRGKRRTCYVKLFYYLRAAKSVIVADADLGPITVGAVCESIKPDTPYRFYLNRYKESRCDFHYYEDHDHLVEVMIETVRTGGRHFVSTNSKKKAEVLLEAIRREFGDKRNTMLVTSETTSDAGVQHFVNNIKSEILTYDVTMASPTLGTGVDITFPNEEQLVDTVFGFFVPRVNTHFDIDQQLSRVRHPKAIKAWVTPERFGFETEPDVIRNEVLDSAALNDVLIGYEEDGRPKLDEGYLNVYAQVTGISRASKNNLRENLLNLRLRNGWKVEHVLKDADSSKEGKKRIDQSKDELAARRADNICTAKKITAEEYRDLHEKAQKGTLLTKDEGYSMRRHEVESFYREEISLDLIGLDDDGRYREKVRTMQIYLTPLHQLNAKSLDERQAGHFVTDAKLEPVKKMMLFKLLNAAGMADEHALIKTDVIVSQPTLAAFAEVCQTDAGKIMELFGVNVRTKDMHTKAKQNLSKILELIGLEHEPAIREKVNGVTTYKYALDVDSWDLVRSVIDKRMGEIVSPAPLMDFSGKKKKPFKKADYVE